MLLLKKVIICYIIRDDTHSSPEICLLVLCFKAAIPQKHSFMNLFRTFAVPNITQSNVNINFLNTYYKEKHSMLKYFFS